jgi:hypothetical protein
MIAGRDHHRQAMKNNQVAINLQPFFIYNTVE